MAIRPPPLFIKVFLLCFDAGPVCLPPSLQPCVREGRNPPALDEAPILADNEQNGRAGLATNVEQQPLVPMVLFKQDCDDALLAQGGLGRLRIGGRAWHATTP